MRKFIVGAAAAAMVAGSSIAQAAPVELGDVRTGSSVAEADELSGTGGTHLMLGLLAAILLGFVLWQINDNDDVDLPRSP